MARKAAQCMRSVLEWMVANKGDKAFFWWTWIITILGMGSDRMDRYRRVTGKTLEPGALEPLVFVLWITLGLVLWYLSEKRGFRSWIRPVLILLGGYGLVDVTVSIAALPMMILLSLLGGIAAPPRFLHYLPSSLIAVLVVTLPMLLPISLGGLWVGYRIDRWGWAWAAGIPCLLFGMRPLLRAFPYDRGLSIDGPGLQIVVFSMLVAAVFGFIGGQLVKPRGAIESPPASTEATTAGTPSVDLPKPIQNLQQTANPEGAAPTNQDTILETQRPTT